MLRAGKNAFGTENDNHGANKETINPLRQGDLGSADRIGNHKDRCIEERTGKEGKEWWRDGSDAEGISEDK